MTIQPIIFYFLSGTIMLIAMLLLVMVYHFVKLVQLLDKTKRDYLHLKSRLGKEELLVLEHAHEKAQAIVKDASKHALSVETTVLTDTTQLQQEYHAAMNALQGKLLAQVSSDMQLQAAAVMDDFALLAKQQTASLKQALSSDLAQELARAKQVRLQQLDEDVARVVADVSRSVLGKVISTHDHEELVAKAIAHAAETMGVVKEPHP